MARFAAASLVLLCLAAAVCSGEASASGRRLLQASNIAQLVSTTPQFSTLNAAINAAGLTNTVSNSSLTWTVFAPTNDAFNNLFKQLNTTAAAVLKQQSLLSTVLRYHIVPTPLKAASFTNGQVLSTLLGQNLVVDKEGNSILIEGYASEALVITPNDVTVGMPGTVVHTINNVLVPKMS